MQNEPGEQIDEYVRDHGETGPAGGQLDTFAAVRRQVTGQRRGWLEISLR